jgi:hypothetical protein
MSVCHTIDAKAEKPQVVDEWGEVGKQGGKQVESKEERSKRGKQEGRQEGIDTKQSKSESKRRLRRPLLVERKQRRPSHILQLPFKGYRVREAFSSPRM